MVDRRGSGRRRPTIRDVAARAGVSKSLVSLVYSTPDSVSPQRREAVLRAAGELGFRPNQAARSLAASDGGFIGILVSDTHNPVFADLVDAARMALAEHGQIALTTTLSDPHPEPRGMRDELDLLADLRPSGLIVVGSIMRAHRLAQMSEHLPTVVASTLAPELPAARTVRGDDWQGMHLLVRHLYELGHRRIQHVGGPGDALSQLRAQAYRAAMAELGLDSHVRVKPADYSQQAGRAAARSLLSSDPRPTAILAVNDLAAVGALEEVRARGQQVAVTGYDATFVAAMEPISLTTVDPDSAQVGRLAAELLLDGSGPQEVLVTPRLIPRGSSIPATP